MSHLSELSLRISLGALKRLLLRPSQIIRLPSYYHDLKTYRNAELSTNGRLRPLRFYPCLNDKRASQDTNDNYFYQDCWASRQVFRENPDWGVDVGSTVLLVGILSQFKPWTSVDIRPIKSELAGLECKAGSVLELPFNDGTVPCLTTMCVLEHIGLGRYGDPLNPNGTEQAAKEIARVLRPGGIVVFSVPVGREVLEFNAHRRFTYEQALNLFKGFTLVDSCVLTPVPRRFESEQALAASVDPVVCVCCRKSGSVANTT